MLAMRSRVWVRELKQLASVTAIGGIAALNTLNSHGFSAPLEVDSEGTRVIGISSTSYAANAPIEDRHAAYRAPDTVLAGVFDGHGGWQCSEYVSKHLLGAVEEEGRHVEGGFEELDVEGFGSVLQRAFSRTERSWVSEVGSAFRVGFGEVARAGSCALVAGVRSDCIVVANAGDCRAVLGRVEGGKVGALALSMDHNARMEREQAKLRQEHPGESNIVVCRSPSSCYTKGRLQPTRSFGDLYLKHSEFNGVAGDRSRGRFIPPPYTPPYITAEPEILAHSATDPNEDLFLVLGTDGLWDAVESEEAVHFVASSLDKGVEPASLAEALAKYCLEKEARAAHMPLARLLDIPPKQRRSYHDDITIQIVFLQGAAQKYGIKPFGRNENPEKQKWFGIF